MTSIAERTLAVQLEQAGIPFEAEYKFHPERRWRADFLLRTFIRGGEVHGFRPMLVEVEGGSFTGGHKRGKAYESDCEKHNAASLLGFRTLRFTPAMVEDGRALEWIRQALGLVA